MERQKKVIDVSAAAKWFLHESGRENALKLLEDHISGKILLIAPELFLYEMLNVLRYKGRNENELIEANDAIWGFQLHIEHPNPVILQKAIQLALKFNLSVYDALYAALAELHECQLVTEDEKLSKVPQAVTL